MAECADIIESKQVLSASRKTINGQRVSIRYIEIHLFARILGARGPVPDTIDLDLSSVNDFDIGLEARFSSITGHIEHGQGTRGQ